LKYFETWKNGREKVKRMLYKEGILDWEKGKKGKAECDG
jgi:hypothetical protein